MADEPVQNGSERRRFKRLPLTTKVRFRKVSFQNEAFVEQNCEKANLGAGGIFLPVKIGLLIGDMIELQFNIPSRADKIEVIGRVSWVAPPQEQPGVGVEFVKLDHKVQEELMKTAKRTQWTSVDMEKEEEKKTCGEA
ncbi:MAG: PilZ domain-containing protein [Planctomycetota bacterium]|nr:PilZ domain-containing protein [Planctomycetota bacterium]